MIGIIGGCGHIGLSLGLVFSQHEKVILVDTNPTSVESVNNGKAPFAEPLVDKMLFGNKSITATTDSGQLKICDTIIVATYGRTTFDIVEQYKNCFVNDQLVVIVSTLSIGETKKIDEWFLANNLKVYLAYCPERISQGKMIEEVCSIPQIISGTSARAIELTSALFQKINPKAVYLKINEAEFAKLYSNTFRYLTFTIENQMFINAAENNIDLRSVHTAIMTDYVRAFDFPNAAFTSGPCLPKDASLLNTGFYTKLIDAALELNNEAFPQFIFKKIQERDVKTVGILGMTFKANCADTRNALPFKLRDMLIENGFKVTCHDPFLNLDSLDEVLTSDVVVIGTPHKEYVGIDLKGKGI